MAVRSPATDRAALVARYNAALGYSWWPDYSGRPDEELGPPPDGYPAWFSAASLDRWQGVETDEAGRVRALDLDHVIDDHYFRPPHPFIDPLLGSIPPELGTLDKLERLDLNGNYLYGPIPAALGHLTRLRKLYLAGNQLSGPIPAALGHLDQLESLDLSENDLDGPIFRARTSLLIQGADEHQAEGLARHRVRYWESREEVERIRREIEDGQPPQIAG